MNEGDPEGWFPLHNAGRGGHKEIAELLISNGADVNVKKDDGRTPLDVAIKLKKQKSPTSSANTAARPVKN